MRETLVDDGRQLDLRKVLSRALGACLGFGVSVSAIGAVGAALAGVEYMSGSNASGVHHLAPAAASLAFAGAAVLTWRPMWAFRIAAAFWALAAACFARPGLVQVGLDGGRVALGVVVAAGVLLAVLSGIVAVLAAGSTAVRLALWAAALAPVFVLVVLVLPQIGGDWAAFVLLIAAAALSPRAAAKQRSFLQC